MSRLKSMSCVVLAVSSALCAGEAASADFVGFVVTSATVVYPGLPGAFTVYTVAAQFDGPTDTVTAANALVSLSGAAAHTGFYHLDNADYNSGPLMTEYGTWNPSQTGAVSHRPFDSYLAIGGQATATNTTNANPAWVSGGNADARSWDRPDLPNNGAIGWFNSNPANSQGRVGNSPGLPSNRVRIGQFVVAGSDTTVREFALTLQHNDGTAGAPTRSSTASFRLCPGIPYYPDADADGYGAAAGSLASCEALPGYVTNNLDCNDANAAINPNTIWYRDDDGDGVGHASAGTLTQCAQPAGYTIVGGDNCPAIANPDQSDCDADGLGDVCELAAGQGDCNSNGIHDACEVAAGQLTDCDSDGIPDICEGATAVGLASPLMPFSGSLAAEHTFSALPRVAGGQPALRIEATADLGGATDGIIVTLDGGSGQTFFVTDGTDCPASPNAATISLTPAQMNALVADGALTVRISGFGVVNSASCPTDGGVRVRLDYLGLPAASDCNGNGLLDSCEVGTGATPDCNGNGVPDSCDIASGVATDCNANGRPDSCDIAQGSSSDFNSNGRPDECSGEFVVGGSGYATIVAAVNAVPAGGTVWVGPGTRTEEVIIQRRVTLRSARGPAETILDGTGIDLSLVSVFGTPAHGTVIEGFTFRNGPTGTELDQFGGGAVALVQADVTVRNCVFTANHSGLGGAIYGAISASTIENCAFTGNTASAAGGAICFELGSGWVVRNCTFSGNTSAGSGGAIHSKGSSGLVELCTISGNTATLMGGAVSWDSLGSGPMSITACTVETNAAASGGALAVTEGTGAFRVLNSRICRNTPNNFAGGVTDLGGNIFSTDCNANGVCDADEISSGGALDCNGNGVIDWCDISSGAALDCNLNGIPDACDISSGAAPDCNLNGVPDGCDLSAGTSLDCNTNGVPDSCDIAVGVSNDVDSNGIPDECKPDCDGDGVPDAWELSQGLEPDCNGNGLIDRCDTAGNPAGDCDQDSVPDSCELAANPSLDCNGNGRLDSCDIAANPSLDCNGNGRIDACDLATTPGLDCDANGLIDSCEITASAGLDKNGNGKLDSCELARGDLNLDGAVNAADLSLLLNFWGFVNPPVGDLNGDGSVGGADLAALLNAWGTTP
jgi:predicted outer membrane repeat protein